MGLDTIQLRANCTVLQQQVLRYTVKLWWSTMTVEGYFHLNAYIVCQSQAEQFAHCALWKVVSNELYQKK